MKKWFIKSLMMVGVLVLVSVLPITGFAAGETEQMAPAPEAPNRYAGPATVAAGSFEDYVDTDAFMAYLVGQMQTCAAEIDITSYGIPKDGGYLEQIGYHIIRNYPEMFHFSWFGPYYYSDGIITKISMRYHDFADTAAEYEDCAEDFDAVVEDLVDGIQGNTWLTDVEKALLLHDRLIVHTEYDKARLENGTIPDMSYTSYGILVKQIGVCQGYALAYDYLLEQVGIRSEYVSSEFLNHAWNIVYINNKPYHVDTTWDDPTWDITGRVNHNNFLRSTSGIVETGHHQNGYIDFTSEPTDTTYDNYYWQRSNTAFQLVGGWIYYIDNTAEALYYLDNGSSVYLFSVDATWYANASQYWFGNFSRLSSDSTTLLYSMPDGIYRYNPSNGAVDKIYSPNLSGGAYFAVYGFKYEGGYLICDLSNTPNYTQYTKNNQAKLFYDKEPPEAEFWITTTPATTQTLTIAMKDNAGISGYYFGTDPDCGDNHYVAVGRPTVTETISNSGVYYVWVKDDGGNLSDRYAITVYKISFNANGGTVTPGYTLGAKGTTITLPTATRTGYACTGWSTSATATTGQTTLNPTGNATYYAVWEKRALNGWIQQNGKWLYYVNDTAKTGWLNLGGTWYYMDSAGIMQTGWRSIGGTWYYFNSSGAMATGWRSIGGWYYFNSSGAMVTGWQRIGSSWYFFNSSGAMVTGWLQSGSAWYYLKSSGEMATRWCAVGGTYYYFGTSGVMQTGWVSDGGVWYYMSSSGAMVTGWQRMGGYWYYFNASGVMHTGWLWNGGKWYAFTAEGHMIIGWGVDGSTYYYFNSDGSMVTGQKYINGRWYTFNSSGVCQNP